MKYILLIVLFFALSCTEKRDYCSECIVGDKYTLYGPKNNGPFEKQKIASVIITDKKDGWVQYCWEHQYKMGDKLLFSRTCEEFIDLIGNKDNSIYDTISDKSISNPDIKVSPGGVSIVIDSGNGNNINVQQ